MFPIYPADAGQLCGGRRWSWLSPAAPLQDALDHLCQNLCAGQDMPAQAVIDPADVLIGILARIFLRLWRIIQEIADFIVCDCRQDEAVCRSATRALLDSTQKQFLANPTGISGLSGTT